MMRCATSHSSRRTRLREFVLEMQKQGIKVESVVKKREWSINSQQIENCCGSQKRMRENA
ncbi:hypothetical protein [Bacillus sp. REN10]|uniref:hypothetical protein n=1 Tax=Bacillus sp. REN10 TaxID=2782541 RepID=UPI00193C0485|nr:hypothetical protein [Bacillus sp. REN10]